MHYVIDINKKYVTHEGSIVSCKQYVRNAESLFGGNFFIVEGAKERARVLKELKDRQRADRHDNGYNETQFNQ